MQVIDRALTSMMRIGAPGDVCFWAVHHIPTASKGITELELGATRLGVFFSTRVPLTTHIQVLRVVNETARAYIGSALPFFCTTMAIISVSTVLISTENVLRIVLGQIASRALQSAASTFGVAACLRIALGASRFLTPQFLSTKFQHVRIWAHIGVASCKVIATLVQVHIHTSPRFTFQDARVGLQDTATWARVG